MKTNKTLIIGPSWVGDMIMSQVLYKAIKHENPHAEIEVLAPQWSRPLTERMPEISHSINMPFKHKELNLKGRYQLAQELKAREYQRSYVLPNSFKSALIPFWAKIPERIGWRGEWRYVLLNDVRILDKQQYPLMVERYEALAYAKDKPLQYFKPQLRVEADNVQKALRTHQLHQDKPILILCPGAEFGPSKRWPEQYYAQIAKHYLAQGWQIWILGSANDTPVAQQIQDATQQQCQVLTGKTSLAEAIDLMSLADRVLSNDSGLMHIAAALDRPLVALYGSTSPAFTPPLNNSARVLQATVSCSPCFKRECPLKHQKCMHELTTNKVIDTLDKLVIS